MSTKKNYCENAKKSQEWGGGYQLGCVQRVEVIVKMRKKKKKSGGGGGRIRADVDEELKFS